MNLRKFTNRLVFSTTALVFIINVISLCNCSQCCHNIQARASKNK